MDSSNTPRASRLADLLHRRFGLLVAALVAVQGLLWIGAPLLFEGSIRLDVAEGAIDGPEWQLSYFRHPPLSTWLSGLAWHTGSFRYAAVYAIGWALASGAFAIVALFLRRVDRPEAGLVALVAGLTSPFATYVPIQVNHNITLMACWAAALATAWFAFEGGALAQWAIFGAVVGVGMWAKYSILHLVIPLAFVFLLTPQWRARLLGAGPWLACAICAAIDTPHFVAVFAGGATTLEFAARIEPSSLLVRLGWVGEFVVDCLAANVVLAAIAALTSGPKRVAVAVRAMMSRRGARLDRFLVAAALGPIVIVAIGGLLGRQSHYLWITAFSVSFAAFWGRAASLAASGDGANFRAHRLALAYVVLACLGVFGYGAVVELGSRFGGRPRYPDMDGPALATMAREAWAQSESGPIPYLVSYGDDRVWPAMQAAGSIVFDLPYRVRTLVEANPAMSRWIDVADLKRRGALVVSVKPLHEGDRLLGVKLENIVERPRPMRRGSRSEPIVFAVLPPGS